MSPTINLCIDRQCLLMSFRFGMAFSIKSQKGFYSKCLVRAKIFQGHERCKQTTCNKWKFTHQVALLQPSPWNTRGVSCRILKLVNWVTNTEMTSLARQLRKLAAPQTDLLKADNKKPSILFDPREAANISRDELHQLGKASEFRKVIQRN